MNRFKELLDDPPPAGLGQPVCRRGRIAAGQRQERFAATAHARPHEGRGQYERRDGAADYNKMVRGLLG